MTNSNFDVIVLGAGGAGLMCALTAGQRGRRVVVLDHADAPGKKILISGGGRCNFTNTGTSAAQFISKNPHFAKSALSRYQPSHFIDLVNQHGIAWHEKTLGQLFCDRSAKQIVAMLLEECRLGQVEHRLGCTIENVHRSENGFEVRTTDGVVRGTSLVIATGGPSIPKMGATGYAYELARQFGLKVVEPRPALVPFTLGGEEALFRELSGVATETIVSNRQVWFREASLFTHKGLSGPAMLQISSYWKNGEPLSVNFLPQRIGEWFSVKKRSKPKLKFPTLLAEVLPARLSDVFCDKLKLNGMIGQASDKALQTAEYQLRNWTFFPSGTEGFAKAEVTVGGISTDELSSKTMEARKVPGLYVVGEAVDVTGWLGGYNFQWAWASGVAAGEAV